MPNLETDIFTHLCTELQDFLGLEPCLGEKVGMSSFYGETQACVSLGGSGFFLHQEVEGAKPLRWWGPGDRNPSLGARREAGDI